MLSLCIIDVVKQWCFTLHYWCGQIWWYFHSASFADLVKYHHVLTLHHWFGQIWWCFNSASLIWSNIVIFSLCHWCKIWWWSHSASLFWSNMAMFSSDSASLIWSNVVMFKFSNIDLVKHGDVFALALHHRFCQTLWCFHFATYPHYTYTQYCLGVVWNQPHIISSASFCLVRCSVSMHFRLWKTFWSLYLQYKSFALLEIRNWKQVYSSQLYVGLKAWFDMTVQMVIKSLTWNEDFTDLKCYSPLWSS